MRRTSSQLIVVLLLLALLPGLALGQARSSDAPGAQSGKLPAPAFRAAAGVTTYSLTRGDSLLERHTVDVNEELRLIIEFQTPPLSRLRNLHERLSLPNSRVSALQSQIELDHTRFRSDLARLAGEPGSGNRSRLSVFKAANSRLTHDYRGVFNGVALTTRRWMMEKFHTLPYVKSVSLDRPLHLLDAGSNHQIGADSVWAALGASGKGIRIGLLDTGIDYTDSALGGGFGAGYKVAGGWNFVNNDSDPMDDNGHGTHVAGIAAADGPSLKGVAPLAILYAYKVLDSKGEGFSSLGIAALEKALDPDSDPATDDQLDILNLSLGGPGDPADPFSQAVDNASASGVLCVVAAGNDGPSYQTIGSPGCATGALTVGACDNQDRVASFSSRGPTNTSFTLKPDLLAPGVDIISTMPGGSYQAMSGTSMATPHVTGAAALLKELHPTWTPAMLKSALMGAAKDLGQDAWTQGKGRVDVLKATRAHTLAFPQSLSFGLDGLLEKQWSQTDTESVTNLTDAAETFAVQLSGALPAGLQLTAAPLSLTVPAHSSATMFLTLQADNSQVQIPQTVPPAVTGVLIMSSPSDTLKVPWTLMVGSYMDLEISGEAGYPCASFTRVRDSLSTAVIFTDFSYTGGNFVRRQLLLPGVYEVIAFLGWGGPDTLYWMVRDSVTVNPAARVQMSQDEALYTVGTRPTDENGAPLDSTINFYWDTRLTSKRTGVGWGFGLGNHGFSLLEAALLNKVCQTSPNFVFDYYYTTSPDRPKVYSYAGRVSPVVSDHVVESPAGEFQRRDIEYRLRLSPPALAVVEALGFQNKPSPSGSYFAASPGLAPPFRQSWYATGAPVTNFPWNGFLINFRDMYDYTGTPPFNPDVYLLLMRTPNQYPGSDGVLRSALSFSNWPVQESWGKKIIYGLGPLHYFARMQNEPTLLRVKTNTWVGMCQDGGQYGERYLPFFLSQAMDYEPQRVSYWLSDSSGKVIGSGTSYNHFLEETVGTQWLDRSLAMWLPKPGCYCLKVWDPASYVGAVQGAAFVLLTVDTRGQDKNPPSMTSFNIIGPDSEYTDHVALGGDAHVEFRTSDSESGLRLVSVSYHTDSSSVWIPLPLARQGERYQAVLPTFGSSTLLSLRVLAIDSAGNSLDYRAEPALRIGADEPWPNRPPTRAHPLLPSAGSRLQLYSPKKKVTFTWHGSSDYDGWDSLSYSFRIRGGNLTAYYDQWTRDTAITVDLMGSLSPNETYQWWIETLDGHSQTQSDTAVFRTSSDILAVPGQPEEEDLPKAFALRQNYPNPFNPATTIRYELPQAATVSLKVYNVLGQVVRTLVEEEKPPGRYAVNLQAQDLASGIYFYRIQAGGFTQTRAMCIVR